MQIKIAPALAALLSIIALGCGGGPSKLIGDWDTSVPAVGPAVVSYNADGSMKMSADFAPGGKTSQLVITGTWKEDGDKLHMTYQDVKFTNLSPETQPKEQAMEDGAKKAIGMGTDNIVLVKFDGNDSFTETDSKGTPTPFKRKGK